MRSMLIGSMAAFGIARLRWKFARLSLTYFLLGMMIPVHCVLIPLFSRFSSFGLNNSLVGLILPYWCVSAWLLWKEEGDFSYFVDHFIPLWHFQFPVDYTSTHPIHIAILVFLVILTLTGVIHFIRTSYNDKIRIRQIYYSFMFINFVTLVFMILQPQTEDIMLRTMIITTSPLIGHFVSLTHTRITNIAFFVILAVSLVLTILSIWVSSSIF